MHSSVIRFASFADMYPTDPFFGRTYHEAKHNLQSDYTVHDGFLFKGLRLCIPECSLRLKIVSELHNEGHVGRYRMFQLVMDSYFWPTFRRDVERFVE